jgi:hypothetical protein
MIASLRFPLPQKTHQIGDDKIVRIEFNHETAGVDTTLAQIFPLARQLRALLSESRRVRINMVRCPENAIQWSKTCNHRPI